MAATAPPAPATTAWRGGWLQGLNYGGLGLPLAFVALPLYVVLPNHYAAEFGIPLATLGALLLGARLLDAMADPWIGRLVDGWFTVSAARVLMAAVIAAVVLALGFRGLFFPAVQGTEALLWWCGALLAVTYLSYSVLSVLHQAWGARLGGDEGQRARIVSWREGLALLGVLVASVLPSVAGLSVTGIVFTLLLATGVALLARAPRPRIEAAPATLPSLALPLRVPAFRRLLAVYLLNGVASAVPATLVLFFIRDRLQAPDFEPLFLASYFAAGALSMPLWVRLVARLGLAWAWAVGMVVAIVTFAWAALLGAGDVAAFTAVCVASGFALGADLTLPGALLTGVIQRAGHAQKLEGAYFGWWNFATKLNLALAAGIALPLLGVFGYSPGGQDEGALRALTLAYCILPCALKLGAAGLLWTLWLRKETRP
ncbi:MAG: MFS transporter [Betaproteobacteria bacterium]|nr:MFS transporter [Betaproteobacteria bacterium]